MDRLKHVFVDGSKRMPLFDKKIIWFYSAKKPWLSSIFSNTFNFVHIIFNFNRKWTRHRNSQGHVHRKHFFSQPWIWYTKKQNHRRFAKHTQISKHSCLTMYESETTTISLASMRKFIRRSLAKSATPTKTRVLNNRHNGTVATKLETSHLPKSETIPFALTRYRGGPSIRGIL